MSTGIAFLIIGVLILFMFNYNKRIDLNKFVKDAQPYFNFLKEEDYNFLVTLRYGQDVDINDLFEKRVRNGLIAGVVAFFLALSKINSSAIYISIILCFVVAFVFYKLPYFDLKNKYKKHLYDINAQLPYYLKSLEILIQHYTVPVAIRKSIETAPEIFKTGLTDLVNKIEDGDSSVEPYMQFAKDYPVRDSMRMMRLLYRLGLGSQENKEQQLIMFSRSISSLQSKAREQKYKDRLGKMESKTMMMLFVTGGGIIGVLLFAMVSMMGI